MKENKLARQPIVETEREEQPAVQPAELRMLDDLELALAGGGDGTTSWP